MASLQHRHPSPSSELTELKLSPCHYPWTQQSCSLINNRENVQGGKCSPSSLSADKRAVPAGADLWL